MKGNEAARKPWYRRKWIGVAGVLLILMVSAYQYIQYQERYLFDRPVQVTRGPWQVLDPGKPVEEPLKFEVEEEGTGTVVEVGDLVQISRWSWFPEEGIKQRDENWWVWVGFRTAEETPFYAMNPRLLSAFIGQREGTAVKFTESPSYIEEGVGLRQRERPGTSAAGKVYINPFGSFNYYAGKKSGYSGASRTIHIPFRPNSGYTIVHIKKVFKGQLKYRTTHLYDDSWRRRCKWWRGDGVGPYGCVIVKTPRENWMDDARYDGVSADGRRATFQYGPVETPEMRKLRTGGGMRGWDQNEWKSLPKGVQVE